MKKSMLVHKVSLILIFVMCASMVNTAIAKDQQKFYSTDDVVYWINSQYYKNPQPDRLIPGLKVILKDDLFLENQARFPIAWFFVTAIHDKKDKIAELENMARKAGGKQKDYLELIVREIYNYIPAEVTDYSWSLDFVWAEFLATGEAGSIEKIISVLKWDLDDEKIHAILDKELNDSKELERYFTLKAAMWSLSVNAKIHPRVRQVCERVLNQGRVSDLVSARLKKVLAADPSDLKR